MSQHKCHFINKAKIPKISKINIIKRLSCHILQSTKKSSKTQMLDIFYGIKELRVKCDAWRLE